MFSEYVGILIILLDLTGISMILFGVVLSVYRILKIEIKRHKNRFREYENTKRIFIQKLIFGLDFFVARDLLKLVIVETQGEILNIAFIVIVRTLLSWSLSKEIHLHEEKMD
ncbi:DUF1622 domain-containing protein [Candidatus Micrarchaeota archaeon]|nr:DUF1622 domain-containing protein [Candidatus Micrarchaeota archaeon]